mmetsp:Transcript_82440/g.229759  ORF Transcript_82440/g.229759 Transcript_82440/m.229759 type:complete len:219 (-) Transcript_82440:86-742(-)
MVFPQPSHSVGQVLQGVVYAIRGQQTVPQHVRLETRAADPIRDGRTLLRREELVVAPRADQHYAPSLLFPMAAGAETQKRRAVRLKKQRVFGEARKLNSPAPRAAARVFPERLWPPASPRVALAGLRGHDVPHPVGEVIPTRPRHQEPTGNHGAAATLGLPAFWPQWFHRDGVRRRWQTRRRRRLIGCNGRCSSGRRSPLHITVRHGFTILRAFSLAV